MMSMMAGRRGSAAARSLPRPMFAAIAVLVLLPACYSTRPLTSAVPAQGTRILAGLTAAGSVQMEPLIGAEAIRVEGIVAEVRQDQWDLRLLRVDRRSGESARWQQELVSFPAGSFTSVVERRVEKGRTAFFIGGLAAGAILVAKVIGLAGIFEGGDDGEPPPVQ